MWYKRIEICWACLHTFKQKYIYYGYCLFMRWLCGISTINFCVPHNRRHGYINIKLNRNPFPLSINFPLSLDNTVICLPQLLHWNMRTTCHILWYDIFGQMVSMLITFSLDECFWREGKTYSGEDAVCFKLLSTGMGWE